MLTLDHETAVDFLNYAAIAGTAIELLNGTSAHFRSVFTATGELEQGKLPKPKKLGNRNVAPEDEADKAIAELVGL